MRIFRNTLLVIVVATAAILAASYYLSGEEDPTPADQDPDPGTETVSIEVYFSVGGEDFGAVNRIIDKESDHLLGAILALLAGPTAEERDEGYHSFFSADTAGMLNGQTVTDEGIATLDFKSFASIIPNASTSAGSAALVGQISRTVFQFPNIEAIDIRFDGSGEAFWNWLQSDAHLIEREN